jgi:hypothetical protein
MLLSYSKYLISFTRSEGYGKQQFKLLKSDRVGLHLGLRRSCADFAGATLVFGSWQVIASGSGTSGGSGPNMDPKCGSELHHGWPQQLLVIFFWFSNCRGHKNYFCWPTIVVKRVISNCCGHLPATKSDLFGYLMTFELSQNVGHLPLRTPRGVLRPQGECVDWNERKICHFQDSAWVCELVALGDAEVI